MDTQEERRHVQRLRLDEPLRGQLSGMRVTVLDLSTGGARVEHSFPVDPGRHLRLRLHWNDEDVSIECDVVRCDTKLKQGAFCIYHSGLRFAEPAEESGARLRQMLTELITQDLERLKREEREH